MLGHVQGDLNSSLALFRFHSHWLPSNSKNIQIENDWSIFKLTNWSISLSFETQNLEQIFLIFNVTTKASCDKFFSVNKCDIQRFEPRSS